MLNLIIEKVGLQAIFSRPKNDSTSLQNSLFEHSSKSRSASKRRKTAQLRSKTASSIQHYSVLVLLRSHFAVTSQSLRGHNVVATRSLRGHNAVTTRSLRGHYGHYAVRKSTYSRLRKRSTSLQNGLFDQDIVAVDLEGSDFINASNLIHYTANRFQV